MNTTRYTVFETRWGYFGLVTQDEAVCRTYLPLPDADRMHRLVLADIGDEARQDDGLMNQTQERIKAYFEGENVDFSTDPAVFLPRRSAFDREVLAACRQIGPGRRVTYGQLADEVGHPGAARAVGSVMARNPIPLIIPCHRVLRSDGALGGFSAPGGAATKKKMLELEHSVCGAEPELFATCLAVPN